MLGEATSHVADERCRRLPARREQRDRDHQGGTAADTTVLHPRRQEIHKRCIEIVSQILPRTIQVPSEVFGHLGDLDCENSQPRLVQVAGKQVTSDHRPGPEARGIALGKAEQLAHHAGRNDLGDRHEVPRTSREPLADSLPSPDPHGLFERRDESAGESGLHQRAVDGVARPVRRGQDVDLVVSRGQLEDRGAATRVAHEDPGEPGGEVGLPGQGPFDEIPRRDEVHARLGDPGQGSL